MDTALILSAFRSAADARPLALLRGATASMH